MYYRQAANQELSRSEYESARLAFYQLLRRRRVLPQFIDRHGEDLFAQACFEWSRRVAAGAEIPNAEAWIVICGWHRTIGLIEYQRRRPRQVSEKALAEEVGAPDIEDAFLEADRARKVREAVEELPLYQRRLLALSYFEGLSVREAARKLGWTASKGQRAHETAKKRILKTLAADFTEELRVEIGLFAFLSSVAARASGHTLPAGLEAALDTAHRGLSGLGGKVARAIHRPLGAAAHRGDHVSPHAVAAVERTKELAGRGPLRKFGDLGRRLALGGAGEAGTAVAGEGGLRVLEVCKGVAAVCIIGGGGGLTGAVLGGGAQPEPAAAHHAAPTNVGHRQVPRAESGRATARVVPDAPTPRTTPDRAPVAAKAPERSHPARAKNAGVEAATAVPAGEATRPETEEAQVEEQFGDLDATGSGGGSTATQGALAETKTTGQSPTTATATSEASPQRQAEEAGAAKEFHGLLE